MKSFRVALTVAAALAGTATPLAAQAVYFQRSDANTDGETDLSDAVFTLNYLFQGKQAPPCLRAADSNDDGSVDISDPSFTLSYLFLGRAPPPSPGLECGYDPTFDALDCLEYPLCAQPAEPFDVVDGWAVVEGDLIIGRADEIPVSGEASGSGASFPVDEPARWTGGVIPYRLAPELPDELIAVIREAVDHWREMTGSRIGLVQRVAQLDFVSFELTESGAFSAAGKVGGEQPILLSANSGRGTVIHEIGHTVGLFHEHQRPDRDGHVVIHYENVRPSYLSAFERNVRIQCDGFVHGAYDHGSIMHYGPSAFAASPSQRTIETIPAGIPIGQRDGLSPGDVAAVLAYYPEASDFALELSASVQAGRVAVTYEVLPDIPGGRLFDVSFVRYSLDGAPFTAATEAEGFPSDGVTGLLADEATAQTRRQTFVWNAHFDLDRDLRLGRIARPVSTRAVVELGVRDRITGFELEARTAEFTLDQRLLTRFCGGGVGDGLRAVDSAVFRPLGGVARDACNNVYFVDHFRHRVRRIDRSTGVITTIAGTGEPGFSGDGSLAREARLQSPRGVALDATRNVYIADSGNHRIRRVEAVTGIITTVAGNGEPGGTGDGGPATAASLDLPNALALDAAGNIYIADSTVHRIRRVDALTGSITTVAGNGQEGYSGDEGPATAARLKFPEGVALDRAGRLYIADTLNDVVRLVEAGTIQTIAGNGKRGYTGDGVPATQTSLNLPQRLAVDGAGNIYVADGGNHRIRRIESLSAESGGGMITTVAGTGTPGFSGDGRRATLSALNGPVGVALDAPPYLLEPDHVGHLTIADALNHRIREVNFGSQSTPLNTIAGNGTERFAGDGGAAAEAGISSPDSVAVDSSGNLYVADGGNRRIRHVEASTGRITTVAGNGERDHSGDGGSATSAGVFPQAVALDSSGNELYVADPVNNRVRRVDLQTGSITTVAGNGERGYDPNDEGGPATAASLFGPSAVAVDPGGALYIGDTTNFRVRRVDSQGRIVTIAGNGTPTHSGDGGPATAAGLRPTGLALGGGTLYLADSSNHRVRRIDLSSGLITTVAGNGERGSGGDGGPATAAQLSAPRDVAIDQGGNLYIADSLNDRIRRVDAATGVITTVAGDGSKGLSRELVQPVDSPLDVPTGIAVDAAGNVYIADKANDVVLRYWGGDD